MHACACVCVRVCVCVEAGRDLGHGVDCLRKESICNDEYSSEWSERFLALNSRAQEKEGEPVLVP